MQGAGEVTGKPGMPLAGRSLRRIFDNEIRFVAAGETSARRALWTQSQTGFLKSAGYRRARRIVMLPGGPKEKLFERA
jgi:hypothetical protein